jgi:hypothetical protein
VTGAQGLPGDTGPPGDAGVAATVAVGSVSTIPAGADASVINVGTTSDALFDFYIPRGATGITGPAGAAATIAVGSVTSGITTSVFNRGTSSAAVFDFVFPSGGSAVQQGWAYVPVQHASNVQVPQSGVKSFWYTVFVNGAVQLNNVRIYIVPAALTDQLRVGIYRGKSFNNASTVLTQQTVAFTPSVTQAGYFTIPLPLQSGQSNTYNNEFIILAIHSSGGANSFLKAASDVLADQNLSCTTANNYAAPGFPPNLAGIVSNGSASSRIACDFT